MAGRIIGAMFALTLLAWALEMLAVALHDLKPYLPVIAVCIAVGAGIWFLVQRNRYR